MAVKLEVQAKEIEVGKIMDEIVSRISFGMGRPNNEKIGNDLLIQKIAHFEYAPVRNMWQLAKNQAGTVGGGNHYVDLFEDEGGFLWIGVHFGSRGFGHKIASGFIALSQNKEFGEKASEGSMDSKPILFEIASDLGQLYRECMILAGHYANLGRMVVINKVVEILGYPKRLEEIHNHHNFSWEETHFGETYQVVRKGCTPAFPGQKGFIGANMMDNSVIVEGIESQESKEGLYSTVHGAGRVLSRTQAAGKKKWLRGEDGKKRPQIVAPGIVNWQMVQAMIESKGIELRGAGADEAPQCYKTLSEVLNYQGPTIKVLHELRPIGVAMAGDTIEDPYRD